MAAGDLSNEQARETLEQILGTFEFSQARLLQHCEDFIRRLFDKKAVFTGFNWSIGDIGFQLLLVSVVLTGVILIIYLLRKVAPFWRIMVQDTANKQVSELVYVRPTPDVLLMEAEKKALKGDFRCALRDIYLSILLELDNRRLVSYNAAKTNCEYLREIKQKAAGLMEPFRSMVNLFEYKWYGLEYCTREDFQKGKELYAVLLKDGPHG